MSDAWETLISNATDTTDAWSALNSQAQAGGGSGEVVYNSTIFTELLSGDIFAALTSGKFVETVQYGMFAVSDNATFIEIDAGDL